MFSIFEEGITVNELIALLSQMDRDRKVLADGCDCINPVTGIELDGGYVTIKVKL